MKAGATFSTKFQFSPETALSTASLALISRADSPVVTFRFDTAGAHESLATIPPRMSVGCSRRCWTTS